jgi:CheY-like chemotaxis protein/DNA-binding CsgD family transcriptional regulator
MATVLVVDDEADLRELLRINLSLDGHRVVGAADGDEALDMAGRENPDLILLDIMMPRRDGWDTLGAMKAGGRELAEIPVLMLTARSDELDQVKGAIEGAVRYITKPFSLAVLRQAVDQTLAGGPEPVQRRHVQEAALRRLARIERGDSAPPPEPSMATPHLTRLEPQVPTAKSARLRAPPVAGVTNLSEKQHRLLDAVAATETVTDAAERLGVSRSYVYASLRRIARKLGVRSGPDLIALARHGAVSKGFSSGG